MADWSACYWFFEQIIHDTAGWLLCAPKLYASLVVCFVIELRFLTFLWHRGAWTAKCAKTA
ncbi:hypothetical protein [Aeromonas sp. 602396]|uniref:hypothetical protein n=1 Tax=Aeromonas sp. 602396 TaxID=2712042 RepID=UPI003B9F8D71